MNGLNDSVEAMALSTRKQISNLLRGKVKTEHDQNDFRATLTNWGGVPQMKEFELKKELVRNYQPNQPTNIHN